MSFSFPFFQLNCRKRSQTAVALQDITNEPSSFIAFLQEPYVHAGAPRCLNRRHNIISSLGGNPRAAIYSHRNAYIWPVASLCKRDLAVAIWDSRTKYGHVLLVSWYWDISEPGLPPGLTAIVQFAEQRGYPLWFSADSNAHSPLWGGRELNARGRKLETFIFANNFSVLNKGGKPTFQNERGDESFIDVTFVSHSLVDLVQDWWVSDEAMGSDHNLIRIQLGTPPPVIKMVRRINKALLPQFKDRIAELIAGNPLDDITTYTELEEEGNFLIDTIKTASNELFPLKPSSSRSSLHYWMNQHLRNGRNALTKDRKQANRRRVPIYTDDYKAKQKQHDDEVTQARQSSLRTFVSEVDSTTSMAGLCRVLQQKERYDLGLLRDPGGRFADNPVDSANIMLDKAFPQSIPLTRDDIKFQAECTRVRHSLLPTFVAPSCDFLSQRKIIQSFKQFLDSKSPGPDGIKPLLLKHLPPSFLTRLRRVMEASYHTSYTPSTWKEAEVIFIPKPGRELLRRGQLQTHLAHVLRLQGHGAVGVLAPA